MMIGAIVGVGVFGLPYAFAQSGFGVGFLWLVVVGVLLLFMQLMFGEVAIQTTGKMRLPGYVGHYIGKKWGYLALASMIFGIWGAMVAYMIVGGEFLHILLEPIFGGDVWLYSYIIAGISGMMMYGGLKRASRIESVVVVTLLFLFALIILTSLPSVQLEHYFTMDLSNVFIPYGVILFSMAGVGIVPEIKDVLGPRHKQDMGKVIMIGMGVIMAIYLLFAFAVVGVTGPETSQTAFEALSRIFGPTFTITTTLLGSLTILSIFMVLGIQAMNTFKYDFSLSHNAAWMVVMTVPVTLFAVGLREFITIAGFIGGVFGGLMGILIVMSYWKMRRSNICKQHHCAKFPGWLSGCIILMFLAGMIITITQSL